MSFDPNLKLWQWSWSTRGGELGGLFFATKEELESVCEDTIYFGEVLGKHSDVALDFELENFSTIEFSESTLKELFEKFGRTISGLNPLEYQFCWECGEDPDYCVCEEEE